MSYNIDKAEVQGYSASVDLIAQQQGTLLQHTVDVEPGLVGIRHTFQQLGVAVAKPPPGRHSDTPLDNVDHPNRVMDMVEREIGQLLDKGDNPKILINPSNKYTQAAGFALGVAKDIEILRAADATTTIGATGSLQTTTEAFSNTVTPATSTSLAVVDLIKMRHKLRQKFMIRPGQPVYCVCSSHSITDLLQDSDVQTIDTNTYRALAGGEVTDFMGFTFITSEYVGGIGTSAEKVYVYPKHGIKLGIGADITHEVAPNPEKRFAIQTFSHMYIGAVRMEANSVVTLDMDHSTPIT